jgi:hypothetical protein
MFVFLSVFEFQSAFSRLSAAHPLVHAALVA